MIWSTGFVLPFQFTATVPFGRSMAQLEQILVRELSEGLGKGSAKVPN